MPTYTLVDVKTKQAYNKSVRQTTKFNDHRSAHLYFMAQLFKGKNNATACISILDGRGKMITKKVRREKAQVPINMNKQSFRFVHYLI